jgi:hypothetical protein
MLSHGYRFVPRPRSQVIGAPGNNEPEWSMAEIGEKRGSPTNASGDLQVVH